jgi:hypothetical protein
MSNNRYTPRGFTMFKHLPEPKPKMRKCMWLMSVSISPRNMLPRNLEYYNVNQLYVPRDTRKGAWNDE